MIIFIKKDIDGGKGNW